jgi:putative membrane protein
MGIRVATGVVVLALVSAPAFAQSKKHPTPATPLTDHEFVMDMARSYMAEIEIGKVAEKQATNDHVKGFAKQMVGEHEKALDEVKSLAAKENIPVPLMLDPKDRALKDHLEVLSGPELDRAYMAATVQEHGQDVALCRTETQVAKNEDVKQYAAHVLPTLEEHLKLAKDTDKGIVGSPAKKSSKTT